MIVESPPELEDCLRSWVGKIHEAIIIDIPIVQSNCVLDEVVAICYFPGAGSDEFNELGA